MKYGIFAFPSKKLQDLANTYRKRYDPHFALIAPHMTLKDSFDASENEIKAVVQQLQELVSTYAPLTIHASRISSFFPATNAIYFRIEPTKQLTAFHKQLQEKIPFGKQKHTFVPHITIAQKMSDSEHDDIFGQLRMMGVDEKDTIDCIHLVSQSENGLWTTYETFNFTGTK